MHDLLPLLIIFQANFFDLTSDFPFLPSFIRPDRNTGHRQNSFSILVCLQYKGGGIQIVKNNLGDWRSPYVQTILSRKEGNWKVNAELVPNFPYVSHNIVAVMYHVPAFIKKRGVKMDK